MMNCSDDSAIGKNAPPGPRWWHQIINESHHVRLVGVKDGRNDAEVGRVSHPQIDKNISDEDK